MVYKDPKHLKRVGQLLVSQRSQNHPRGNDTRHLKPG